MTSSVSGVASRRSSTERSKRRQGGVSAGLLAEQHEALIDNLGCKKRGHIPHIVRRADRVHVDRNDIETDKAAQKLDALARRQATPARRRFHFFNSFLRLPYDGGINEYEDPDQPFVRTALLPA